MTHCVSELLEQGWALMQQHGIPQGRVLVVDAGEGYGIRSACALGAMWLALHPELIERAPDHDLTVSDVSDALHVACPALKQSVNNKGSRSVFTMIWQLNDNFFGNYDHDHSIPEIIAWTKEQGL